jgi:hypothetical protein
VLFPRSPKLEPKHVRVLCDPAHGFNSGGLLNGSSPVSRRASRHNLGQLSKLAIALGITRVVQCAPYCFQAFVLIAFQQPAADSRVRSLGALALVCSNLREEQVQPLGGPFLPPGSAYREKDARQASHRAVPVAIVSMVAPLDAIEQLSYLIFLKQLDERQQDEERAAKKAWPQIRTVISQ